jgi:decaprenyl-phosphate phosphoribosyltransferase
VISDDVSDELGEDIAVAAAATSLTDPLAGPARSPLAGLASTARPVQWTKNLLVFAAPGAAGVLDDWPDAGRAMLAFVAFCLAASGVYFWNDALDVEADRRHPTKRERPIAAGSISVRTGQVAGTLLLAAGCGLAGFTGRWQTVAIVATYVATTILYSVWLKHVAVVDLVLVASGFVLRAAAGAVAVDVEMSKWFVLCTVFGSLFIVTGKRYAELREMGADAGEVRPTLATYTPGYLRVVLTMSCGAAIISYCQWAFETKELSNSDLPFYELSIVPMLTALLRYALVLEDGHGAAPEEVFASDRVLQLLGLVWVALFALGVYLT